MIVLTVTFEVNIQIETGTEHIKPVKSEKLLGIHIQNDLKWSEYIINDEKSLIKQLNLRINALQIVSMVYFAAKLSTKLHSGVVLKSIY